MARFDVYRFSSSTAPLVVDVQANVLEDLKSCAVIPLIPASLVEPEELPRLKPKLRIDGEAYILMTTDIAALPRKQLGAYVTNLEGEYQYVISNALDFLLTGF